jgi:DNA-binding transcriptional MerR regulator
MTGDASSRSYKLEELADEAGVTPRTVRYYVQRGLLPPPVFRGKDSAYGVEHALRLKAIKRLQDRFLPLDAIQEALAGRTAEQIERLGVGEPESPPLLPLPPVSFPPSAIRWERTTLAPGLELHLAEDASPAVRALASRIRVEAQNPPMRPDGRGGSRR